MEDIGAKAVYRFRVNGSKFKVAVIKNGNDQHENKLRRCIKELWVTVQLSSINKTHTV